LNQEKAMKAAKILLIEDEAHIRDEVLDWLRFEGYEAIGATNGRLGLEAARQELPDLILCDIAMPEMSGHEVLAEARANVQMKQIPFIFLTAAAERESVRKGMEMGADDYLTKPFTHAEVLNAIHTRLDKRAALVESFEAEIAHLDSIFTEERKKHLLKSRLVAMFSHDFRTPLSLILLSTDILAKNEARLSPDRKQRQYDRIRGSIHSLTQMLDDMLMVAEMESGYLEYVPQSVALSEFVGAIVDEFRLIDQGAHELTLDTTIQGQIQADPKLLRQIITNLVSNAIKYSPPETEVTVNLYEEDGQICLLVRDQGIGVPPESQQFIFDPFHRAENAKQMKGTGLGLAIVKECVDHHHGRIEFHSVLGKGTEFLVRLPLVWEK
jgi:two-component system sensor histidine kinase/response regulator